MWDIKLLLLDLLFNLNLNLELVFIKLINTLDPYLMSGLFVTNFKLFYKFVFNSSIFFAIKFLASIGFLILVRGGTPRYRYDYLTKLGWLKFIGLVIVVFFFSITVFFLF